MSGDFKLFKILDLTIFCYKLELSNEFFYKAYLNRMNILCNTLTNFGL